MFFIPSSFAELFLTAAPVFSQPSFQNFLVLLSGWILCTRRRTITHVIQAVWPQASRKHFSVYYRFFSRAQWSLDALGQVLFHLCLPLIHGSSIVAIVDDTLCKKSGPHLFGAAMHHDASASTYGRFTSTARRVSLAFGHRFVILSIWVPLPWALHRGVALPVLFRLYRSPRRTPATHYRKATQLAGDLVNLLGSWLPTDRTLTIVGDCEYACKTLVRALPEQFHFVGPVLRRAALYDFPRPRRGQRRGAPRLCGRRLASLARWAGNSHRRWKNTTALIYGRRVSLKIKHRVCLWFRVAYRRPVRVVLVRDPKGIYGDQAFFSTDLSLTPEQIIETFARRWAQEVTHRDAKQHLGLEDPQNGWWRRPPIQQRRKNHRRIPGPQPHATRGSRAVTRTAPLALISYSFVCLWYFQYGKWKRDVQRIRVQSPWYRHKTAPSFEDMLLAARRAFCTQAFFRQPWPKKPLRFIRRALQFAGIPA